MYFSLKNENAPLALCDGTPVAECVAVCVPTDESNFSHHRLSKRKRPSDLCPSLARETEAGRDCQSLVLVHEGLNLNVLWLPQEAINTIQSSRAPCMCSLYDLKCVFEDWCTRKGVIHFQCEGHTLIFPKLNENGRVFSTIKVYLDAILVCHVGFK